MVTKFLNSNFTVMLFHYDGEVDDWKELEWSVRVVHVSAFNQTKWWFAKRFLHPDIVAEYDYIFLWDEDLGVENFHPDRYISIIEEEGLEISQPELDVTESEVHHQITARGRGSTVHRRTYKLNDPGKGCDSKSMAPPSTGLDIVLRQVDYSHSYVGIVDAEYIVHYNWPTLGSRSSDKALPMSMIHDPRVEVRRQSYIELELFRQRQKKVVEEDKCWTYPYPPAAE